MRQANREAITEMAITIRVIAENGRYDPMQIAGLADSITALAFEDAFGPREEKAAFAASIATSKSRGVDPRLPWV